MANAATWERRVAQWRESGQTATEFSRGRGFSSKTLVWWASRLKRQAEEGEQFPMARVIRGGVERAESGVTLEVGGACIRLERGFDPVTLGAALSVLRQG